MSLNVVSQSTGELVPVGRQFSRKRSRTSSSTRKGRMQNAMRNLTRPGLYRYLKNRGTPSGSYEIPRTITYSAEYDTSGFVVGAARYEAIAFDFSPLGLGVTFGPSGTRSTINFNNSSEFAAVFDKCKIQKVDCTIQCPTPAVAGTSSGVPFMLICEDDTDAAPSFSEITQMDCVSWNPGFNTSEWKGQIKPKFQQIVYYTNVISSYQPSRGYVVADTAIPHYGLKCAIQNQLGAGRLRFIFKVHMAFKEPK